MQLTPTKLGIAVLLAFSSIGIAVGGPQLLIGPPPVTCIMRPMTKGCTLTLSKDGIFLAQVGPALETTGNDLTIQAYDGSGNYTCCLTCPDTQKISTVISTTTTVPGTTIQPTTFPLSTTTTTNPPSTAQPTTPPATAQSTTAQAGPTVLIGDPPATCTMRPETKGCSLELYKLHGSLRTLIKQRGPALKNSNLDYTLQAFAGPGNYVCVLTCPQVNETATTMIGDTTTSGTTFPPSTTTTTNPPSTAQPTTLPETAQPTTVPESSTAEGPTTTFLQYLTTTTNPLSTEQPTTIPAGTVPEETTNSSQLPDHCKCLEVNGETRCKLQGGKCKDLSADSCDGGQYPASNCPQLCPGRKVCCVPVDADGNKTCTARGGECQNAANTVCMNGNGYHQTGLCPGFLKNQCCLPFS